MEERGGRGVVGGSASGRDNEKREEDPLVEVRGCGLFCVCVGGRKGEKKKEEKIIVSECTLPAYHQQTHHQHPPEFGFSTASIEISFTSLEKSPYTFLIPLIPLPSPPPTPPSNGYIFWTSGGYLAERHPRMARCSSALKKGITSVRRIHFKT